MSKQRIIKDELWDDTWFSALDAHSKLVWVYLLTNPRCNVAGIYKLNRTAASTSLLIEKNNLDNILNCFSDAKKVLLHEDWVFIVNFWKHQTDSPKIRAGIKRILFELPKGMQEVLIGYQDLCKPYRTLLNLTLLNSTLPNGEMPDGLDGFFEEAKYDAEDLRLATLLHDLIKGNNPDWTIKGKIETWAEHIEKLRRIDKRTTQQIEFMIRWTQHHSFWQANILSTAKLREKFSDLIPKVKQEHAKNQNQKPKYV